MSARQVREDRDRDQHGCERQVVAQTAPVQQQRVDGFVDAEATGGHQEETRRGPPERRSVITEGQTMMPRKGHGEGHEPAEHVGHQRTPSPVLHQPDHDAPMHRSRCAADGNEPGNPSTGRDDSALATDCEAAVHVATEHSRARTICICVDDFGLHAGINNAALRLAAMERIHAIGCLVGGPAWKAWRRLLRRLDGDDVDIGLHLDLTESPLLPGSRRSLRALIAASLLRQLDRPALRAEIRAQLDAFEQTLGHGPAFVDGHQHVHQLAVVRGELLEELENRYGGRPPWLRSTRSVHGVGVAAYGGWRGIVKPWGIEQLGARGLASRARRLGFAQNRRLLGVYDFQGGPRRYRELLTVWLRCARDADLLMCHPSMRLNAQDALIDARHAEFQVLGSADFGGMLRNAGVRLWPMSKILARAGLPV